MSTSLRGIVTLLLCDVTDACSPGPKVQLKLFSRAVFPDDTIDEFIVATRQSIRIPMKHIDPLNLIIPMTSPAAVTISPWIGVRSEHNSTNSSLIRVAWDPESANRVVSFCSKIREFLITIRRALHDTFLAFFLLRAVWVAVVLADVLSFRNCCDVLCIEYIVLCQVGLNAL